MEDRRKLARKYLTFFSRVVDRRNGQLVGYLADLTTGGAMLIGEKELAPGTILYLRIDLPENFSRKVLDLNVKVVWSSPDVDPGTYRAGIRFLDISPEEISFLGRLASEFGYHG